MKKQYKYMMTKMQLTSSEKKEEIFSELPHLIE